MSRPTTRIISLIAVALVCGLGAFTALAPAEQRGVPGAAHQRALPLPSTSEAPETQESQRGQEVDTASERASERASGGLAGARAFSAAFADAAAAATPAVVQIRTERSLRPMQAHVDEMFDRLPEGHPAPEIPYRADGTGFLVSGEGLILTNNHVISGADRIQVILWDKRVLEATVVGTDPTTDLALIAVTDTGLPSLNLGDSERLQVGEWVLAIGNPGFRDDNTLDFTVTSGIVSAKGRPLRVIQEELATEGDPAAAYAIEDFIQTDAAINPGNSGGPLLDLNGEVVGINTAIASANGINQGYGFAVPVNVARRVMRDLLEFGHVRRPLLGISILSITPEDAQVYGLPRIAGVLVEDFADDSPAERAGMERHDVIIAVDGVAVERLGQFQRLIAARDPGETVAVDLVRYGERRRVRVRLKEADLGTRPVVRAGSERRPSPDLGLELVDLTPSLARERKYRQEGGAFIAAVVPGSAAARKNVPRGFVIREINRRPIGSAREADGVLDALARGSVASLLLEDGLGGTMIRNVRVP